MIDSLTKEQWDKVPVYLEKWLAIGKRTETIDRANVTQAIYFFYEQIMKIEKPEIVLFFESPMACEIVLNLLKNLGHKEQLGSQLDSQLGSQLGSQLDSQLYSQLRSQLGSQLGSQLDSQLGSQLGSQLRSQLDSQLRSQLRSQLGSQLGSQLDSQLGSQLGSQLRSQLDSQLRSQLRSQLDSQLYSQLGSQLRSQLYSQLGSQALKYFSYSLNNMWWTSYYGLYSFISSEILPGHLSCESLFNIFLTHFKELHFSWFMPKIAIVSDFPESIKMENGRLHNPTGPSVRYRDSWSIYSLFGVSAPKGWIDKKPTAKEVLAQENAELRMVGMKYLGMDKFLDELEYKVVNKMDTYELMLIKLNNSWCEYLKMTNMSTGETHLEGILPGIKTVKEALAWRNGTDDYIPPDILT